MKSKKYHGFSLLEILVTFAIVSILFAVATPSWQFLVNDGHLGSQANSVMSSLALARTEAIKRGLRITVCKSADGAACSTTSEWHQGWLMFVDPSDYGTVNPNEEILLRQDAFAGSTQLSVVSNNFSNFLSFMPNGVSRAGPGPSNSDQFLLCDPQQAGKRRMIKVDATGHTSLSVGAVACS